MLKIEMLRAGHGDCLWIEYGDPKAPRRVLIDGGATGTHKRALRPKLLRASREGAPLRTSHGHPHRCRPHRGRPRSPGRQGSGLPGQRHLVQRLSTPPRRESRHARSGAGREADRPAGQAGRHVERRLRKGRGRRPGRGCASSSRAGRRTHSHLVIAHGQQAGHAEARLGEGSASKRVSTPT